MLLSRLFWPEETSGCSDLYIKQWLYKGKITTAKSDGSFTYTETSTGDGALSQKWLQ